MTKSNITILATYWNEKDWIKASLDQIDALRPKEAFICDGCFDNSKPNRSTDGTREIIKAWTKERPWAHMVTAKRYSRIKSLWYLFGKNMRIQFLPLRIALALFYSRKNMYRINQAVTFSYMLRKAKDNKPGDWIMHIDCDQFYPDEMIEEVHKETNNKESDTDILTATEQTFFDDFGHFTNQYDPRTYNNMPYRLQKNVLLVPTRDLMIERYKKPTIYGKDTTLRRKPIGSYFHYKFKPNNPDRVIEGNNLGDRKQIDSSQYAQQPFTETHPSIVQRHFNL